MADKKRDNKGKPLSDADLKKVAGGGPSVVAPTQRRLEEVTRRTNQGLGYCPDLPTKDGGKK